MIEHSPRVEVHRILQAFSARVIQAAFQAEIVDIRSATTLLNIMNERESEMLDELRPYQAPIIAIARPIENTLPL